MTKYHKKYSNTGRAQNYVFHMFWNELITKYNKKKQQWYNNNGNHKEMYSVYFTEKRY